jgi:CBS domain-containing membrane protein
MTKIEKNLDFYNFIQYGKVSEEHEEKKRALKVSDIMSKDPFSLNEDDEILILDEVMELEKIHHVPVINKKNEVVGILTHRDFLAMLISIKKDSVKQKVKVSDVMKREIQTIQSEESLISAAERFYKNEIGSLLVVSEKKLVGIITPFDLLKLFNQKDLFLKGN